VSSALTAESFSGTGIAAPRVGWQSGRSVTVQSLY
jgi:hypothetical protein